MQPITVTAIQASIQKHRYPNLIRKYCLFLLAATSPKDIISVQALLILTAVIILFRITLVLRIVIGVK